ncbi:MAG: prolyl oligopeptidase family serine peptidase [Candidatus Dormiibacterota bacterium]
MKVPQTPAEDLVETLHGVPLADPYRWLESGDDAAVQAWAAAQDTAARTFLAALPNRDAIRRRLEDALGQGSLGGSLPRPGRRFFLRRDPGHDQPALYCAEAEGTRLLFDPTAGSAEGTSSLDWWRVSRDGELLCLGVSQDGTEDSTLRLLRVADASLLPDAIAHCRLASVVFEPDGGALLYTRYPDPAMVPPEEAFYHRHVWRHVIGAPVGDDQELFGEGRAATDYPALLSIAESGAWTAITVSQGWDRTAVFLRSGEGGFEPIFEGEPAILEVWFAADRLLGLTNRGAPNFRLVEIDPADPAPARWQDVVAESDSVLLGATSTRTRLLVHHLHQAASRVTVCLPDGTPERELPLPGLATATSIGGDPDLDEAYVTVESFTSPPRTLGLEGDLVAELPAPPGLQGRRWPTRQLWFSSADGTRVPMFLFGRESGPGPTLLTGYGGFNVSRTPAWTPTLLPFLEAGGLVALPNLRGGGEFGEAWHQAGRLGQKQHVFDDFIAAASWLVEQGVTTPEQLAIMGGSNGGLLVAAALTQRPNLFGAVVCQVALLDMLRYERFKVARLWAAEYGSAGDPEAFRWLSAYSPYHRVEDGVRYPPILLTAGVEDTRVDPMHARKMTARLQAANPDGTVLLRLESRAGHGQGKPTSMVIEEQVDVLSFLGWALH